MTMDMPHKLELVSWFWLLLGFFCDRILFHFLAATFIPELWRFVNKIGPYFFSRR
jgi:hypothetical protein